MLLSRKYFSKQLTKKNRRTIGGWWDYIYPLIYIAQTQTSSFAGNSLKTRGAVWLPKWAGCLVCSEVLWYDRIAQSNYVLPHTGNLYHQKGIWNCARRMFSSTGETQNLPCTGVHRLWASSLRPSWKQRQEKISVPALSSVGERMYPNLCCWDRTSVASSGWSWILLRAAEEGPQSKRHMGISLSWWFGQQIFGFLGELQTEHIPLPSSPWAAWLPHLVAVQECRPQPASSKSAGVLTDLGNSTGGGGKTNKEANRRKGRHPKALPLPAQVVGRT